METQWETGERPRGSGGEAHGAEGQERVPELHLTLRGFPEPALYRNLGDSKFSNKTLPTCLLTLKKHLSINLLLNVYNFKFLGFTLRHLLPKANINSSALNM